MKAEMRESCRVRQLASAARQATAIGLFLGLLLLAGCAYTVKSVSFPGITPDTKPPRQGTFPDKELIFTAWLTRPRGDGPFPAVVVLHGCFGIFSRDEAWARQLAEWGYVSLLPDGFGPRGERSVCDEESRIPASIRAHDAHAAKAYLASLPFVRKDRIAVIGWGHGAQAALYAASSWPTAKSGVAPFRAAVAFYPWCLVTLVEPKTPLMILIGERDALTPVHFCRNMAIVGAGDYRPDIHVYPGAVHGFDLPDRIYGGPIAYNAAAATDSERRVKDFLARHLR